jgi:hypothetical protein
MQIAIFRTRLAVRNLPNALRAMIGAQIRK